MLAENPYLAAHNIDFRFDLLAPGMAAEAAQYALQRAKNELESIYTLPTPTYQNSLAAFDALVNDLGKVYAAVYLMAFTHPDEGVRNDAMSQIAVIEVFLNDLQLDQQLYETLKRFAQSPEAALLQGPQAKFLRDTIADFERNGLGLQPEQKAELSRIKNRLSEIGNQFEANLAAYEDHLLVPEEALLGLPDDYRTAHQHESGLYKIDLSYPSYRPFMKYSASDEHRRLLHHKFLNRATAQNDPLVREIVELRHQQATLLGYSSYAAYQLEDKMAANPATVWSFEQSLQEKLRTKAQADYQELLDEKTRHTGKPTQNVEPWEAAYYENLLLVNRYQVDDQELKQYFALDAVIEGVFRICEQLFGIQFRQRQQAPVWHPEVRMYDVEDATGLVGSFYLDLFPRPNKYGHAAMFPIVAGRATAQGYESPVAALVCNFPRPTPDAPSLLPHGEVETYFHEFGHLLHGLLTRAEISMQAGTSVSRDFVETPSQIFENWAWDYASLSLFARHYRTGEVLPKDLHQRMLAAKNVNSGNMYLQQLFYGTLDMCLHDRWPQYNDRPIVQLVEELQNSITLFPYLEGTHFHASFGHLNGYAAGYYGYLWARVYAEDFFSRFQQEGLLHAAVGQHYRDTILASGASVPAAELVRQFLGREPQQEAFLRSIGLSA